MANYHPPLAVSHGLDSCMGSPIVDWITPKGQSLVPHIPWNTKSGHGLNHNHTGAFLCPAGLDWKNIKWVLIFIVLHYLFDMYVASSTRTKLET